MKFIKIDIDECYSYLLITEKYNAILIDPKLDYAEYYLNLLNSKNLNLKLIIDTHTHADHLTAAYYLRERTNSEYWRFKDESLSNIDRFLEEGEKFNIDELNFAVIYTPGHTNNSMSLICEDKLFTGDFLFLDGSGRDDLPTGNDRVHYENFSKLKNLKEHLIVCPAHNYGQNELATLHQVRKENPVLNCSEFEEFKKITKPDTSAPEWMNDIVKLNNDGNKELNVIEIQSNTSVCQKGAGSHESLDSIPYINKIQLNKLMNTNELLVVDVRNEEEFEELKPIKESIFINIKDFPFRVKELVNLKDKTIVTVCKSGVRAMKAAKMIKGLNIGKVFVLEGGIENYRKETE